MATDATDSFHLMPGIQNGLANASGINCRFDFDLLGFHIRNDLRIRIVLPNASSNRRNAAIAHDAGNF